MTDARIDKEQRKEITAAADDRDEFEVTEFGRRRRHGTATVLLTLAMSACMPIVALYQRLRRPRDRDS